MLTKEEVLQLTSRAQQGDKHSLDVLFKNFKPFRYNLASTYSNKGMDMDDVIQYVDYMFVKSVLDYDGALDKNPIRHIVYNTRQMVYINYRREMTYKKRCIPRGLSIYTGSENLDTSAVEVEDILEKELDPRERLVVKLVMYGYPQVEIADIMRVSPPTVSRLLASARRKLKNFPLT